MRHLSSKYLLIISVIGISAVIIWFPSSPQFQAAGTTLYVATNGTDSGSCGASANPCRTLQQAFNLAGPGDTILIRSGTYAGLCARNKGGSPSNPITIKPDTGAMVTLDGAITPECDPGFDPVFYFGGGAAYITIDGHNGTQAEALRITQSDWGMQPSCTMWTPGGGTDQSCCFQWVRGDGSPRPRREAVEFQWEMVQDPSDWPHHITIQNTEIVHVAWSLIAGWTNDLQLLNNHMHNEIDRNITYVNPYGTYLMGERLTIRGNRIHGLYVGLRFGTGGKLGYARDYTVEQNMIYDNWGKGAWWTNTEPDVCWSSAGGSGIVAVASDNLRVRNNVVYGNVIPDPGVWGDPARGGIGASACRARILSTTTRSSITPAPRRRGTSRASGSAHPVAMSAITLHITTSKTSPPGRNPTT
jgi:hypothetical protein